MNNSISRFHIGAEKVLILSDTRRSRLGKLPGTFHIVEDILRSDIHTVTLSRLPQDIGERHDSDAARSDAYAEIASAVCSNFDHNIPPVHDCQVKILYNAERKPSHAVENSFIETAQAGTMPKMLSVVRSS